MNKKLLVQEESHHEVDMSTKNEIYFGLFDQRHVMRDVAVVPSFDINSVLRQLRFAPSCEEKMFMRALLVPNRTQRSKVGLQVCISSIDWSLKDSCNDDY
ncbi:unnamed protein product [Soboliphyme baturini]|uniref:ATP-dependent DNA helicase n=1 Tax=Soboliphyme baturini TaxID=241478 RepID=A0A183J7Z4_9BILA|nr:unnamed protein product [Soboliphyme baturini]